MIADRHDQHAGERDPNYGPETPVPIFQRRYEFEQLLAVYRARRPKRVLEVGTYHGGTLYHWLREARFGTTVVSVDSYAVGVDNRHLYPAWTPAGVTLHAVCADSNSDTTASQVAAHGPYDWIWIDAGHYYHEVARDWQLYRPLAATGGVVCFHDILPPSRTHPEIEVDRLWREIQRQGYVTQEIVADAAADWGGIGVVYL